MNISHGLCVVQNLFHSFLCSNKVSNFIRSHLLFLSVVAFSVVPCTLHFVLCKVITLAGKIEHIFNGNHSISFNFNFKLC